MRIEYPHNLPQEQVKSRLEALGEYLQTKHGIRVKWEGDVAYVKGRYLVVAIEGTVSLNPGVVVFEGRDPGFMWRHRAKMYLHDKLGAYLDPSANPAKPA